MPSNTVTVHAVVCAFIAMLATPSHSGAQSPLGTAKTFGVLGASTVTNTGPTTIKGDLGVSPGTAITGIGSITLAGAVHAADAVARQAQSDASVAFTRFSALPSTRDLSGTNLGGLRLTPGVYSFSSSAQLTGTLTLDFLGNPNSFFVFQIGSTLTTASLASVLVLNGGTNSGLYWLIGSSATLGTGTSFMGNILARESITMTTGAGITCGRAIALNAAVTLDHNTISNDCGAADFGSGASAAVFPRRWCRSRRPSVCWWWDSRALARCAGVAARYSPSETLVDRSPYALTALACAGEPSGSAAVSSDDRR